jgi:hypothetical protein
MEELTLEGLYIPLVTPFTAAGELAVSALDELGSRARVPTTPRARPMNCVN